MKRLISLSGSNLFVPPPDDNTEDHLTPEVQQLCDDFFNWRVLDMPEYATFVS